jgi:hypothetical protein
VEYIALINENRICDQELERAYKDSMQMIDDLASFVVQSITDYFKTECPNIKVSNVTGTGFDTIMLLSLKDDSPLIQFHLENYLLEVFLIDRDEIPPRLDKNIFIDHDYFALKASMIFGSRLLLIVALAECKTKEEVEECMRDFYSTGIYERIRYRVEEIQ